MKLIKKGIIPAERIWRGTCRNYNSEFEAFEKELTITYDQRDGNFAIAKCGICGSNNTLYFYLVKNDNTNTGTPYIYPITYPNIIA